MVLEFLENIIKDKSESNIKAPDKNKQAEDC